MTGIYPHRIGMQHLVIGTNQPLCTPLDAIFMPQVFKQNGYSTHMFGKWHLGFCHVDCTPTKRGFDTFNGYYQGQEDHYTKMIQRGYDYHNGTDIDAQADGIYSAEYMATNVEKTIANYGGAKPMFLYVSFAQPHTPLQAPQEYLDMYPDFNTDSRQAVAAMVTAADDAVGRIKSALENKGLWKNTIVIFSSDNGGWTPFGGSNWPLRGGKQSLFEGGTRVPFFVYGPPRLLDNSLGTFSGLMHAVDLFPTIMDAAGIPYTDNNQDGISQWAAINGREEAQRNEVLYNMDLEPQPTQGEQAIRIGDWKLMKGYPGLFQDWVVPDSEAAEQIQGGLGRDSDAVILPQDNGMFRVLAPGDQWKKVSKEQRFLFNLKDDPNETTNLYLENPAIAARLEARLADIQNTTYFAPYFPDNVIRGLPLMNGGNWQSGWCTRRSLLSNQQWNI